MQTCSVCGNVLQSRNGGVPADPARPKASFVKRTGTLSSPFQSAAASLQFLCRRRGPWLNLAIQKDLTRWPRKGKTLKIEAAAADAVPSSASHFARMLANRPSELLPACNRSGLCGRPWALACSPRGLFALGAALQRIRQSPKRVGAG